MSLNNKIPNGLNLRQKIIKRLFDIVLATLSLLFLGWIIVLLIVIAGFDTNSSGIFLQKRVGQNGNLFNIYKLRTIKKSDTKTISKIGRFFRTTKLDELPQLVNVFIGTMSFVGPRPDIEGFADKLKGGDRLILSVKPGITGPASIYFKNEEALLNNHQNPILYNEKVIWPKKIALNLDYIKTYSFKKDMYYIFKTIFN